MPSEQSIQPASPRLSHHAMRRMAQRNVRPAVVEFIADNFDLETPARRGCIMARVSEKRTQDLLSAGEIDSATACAARGVQLVLSDAGNVVTAYRLDPRRLRLREPSNRRGRRAGR